MIAPISGGVLPISHRDCCRAPPSKDELQDQRYLVFAEMLRGGVRPFNGRSASSCVASCRIRCSVAGREPSWMPKGISAECMASGREIGGVPARLCGGANEQSPRYTFPIWLFIFTSVLARL